MLKYKKKCWGFRKVVVEVEIHFCKGYYVPSTVASCSEGLVMIRGFFHCYWRTHPGANCINITCKTGRVKKSYLTCWDERTQYKGWSRRKCRGRKHSLFRDFVFNLYLFHECLMRIREYLSERILYSTVFGRLEVSRNQFRFIVTSSVSMMMILSTHCLNHDETGQCTFSTSL